MINNPFFLYLLVTILIVIYKYFLRKGGIILKIDGIFLKKVGAREKDSKWVPFVQSIGMATILIILLDYYIKFIQQEADKIQ